MGFLRGLKINMRKAHPRGKMLISKVALAGTLGLACILLIANFDWNPGVDPKDCEYWFIQCILGNVVACRQFFAHCSGNTTGPNWFTCARLWECCKYQHNQKFCSDFITYC